jgi:hypothetical protein
MNDTSYTKLEQKFPNMALRNYLYCYPQAQPPAPTPSSYETIAQPIQYHKKTTPMRQYQSQLLA